MTNEIRQPLGVTTGGQYATHNRTEAEVALAALIGATDGNFSDTVRAFERKTDREILDIVTAYFSEDEDGRVPNTIVLRYSNDQRGLEIDEVLDADGKDMFDLYEHRDLLSETTWLARHYSGENNNHRILLGDLGSDLAAVEREIGQLEVDRAQIARTGLARAIRERFEYATTIYFDHDEYGLEINSITDDDGDPVWDITQENVDGRLDAAREYQDQLSVWTGSLNTDNLSVSPQGDGFMLVLPKP
jgi:hypothetical protein